MDFNQYLKNMTLNTYVILIQLNIAENISKPRVQKAASRIKLTFVDPEVKSSKLIQQIKIIAQ